MPRYTRILARHEADYIRTNGRVPTNRSECLPYPPGSVVFLFTNASAANPKQYRLACDELASDAIGNPVVTFRLTLTADLLVEPDESGWAPSGAVVHRGEIALAGTKWTLERYP